MKKNLLLFIFIFLVKFANSQTSHTSGFYDDDSIYFTASWEAKLGQEVRMSINNFTIEGYKRYNEGVWVKSRDKKNTWEEDLYTTYDCEYPSDPSQSIGDREKVNIIRLGLFDIQTNTLLKDSVYVIGLSKSYRPYYNFFITLDSNEFVNMMTHYDDDIRIRAWVTLFSDKGELEANQPVEFYIAAGSSACIANKGFMIKGNQNYPILGEKTISSSAFSKNYEILKEKRIKLRSGNGGHGSKFGVNEVVQRILDFPSSKVGGVKNNVGVIYINGSYWSLTFPQRKYDDERDVSIKLGVNKDSIDLLSLFSIEAPIDTIYKGCEKLDECGYYVKFDYEYDSIISYIYKEFFNFDTLQFLAEDDTRIPGINNLLIVRDVDNKKKIIGTAINGSENRFQLIAQSIVNLRNNVNTTQITDTLRNILDIDNWLRYIVVCNYFHLHDIIFNNVIAVQTSKDKPFLISSDYDYFNFQDGINSDNWDSKIVNDTEYEPNNIGFLRQTIRLILSQPKFQERMIQIYQGMVNTIFTSDRMVSILDEFKKLFINEYPYHHQAWGGYPNGGQSQADLVEMFTSLRAFLLNRNSPAIQILSDRWQSNYDLKISEDQHLIKLVFDSIEINSAEIIINNDEFTIFKNNWSGKYLNFPEVTIKINDLSGKDQLYVKEFPDNGLNFSFNPNSDISITLLRKGISTGQIFYPSKDLKLFPNPTNDFLKIDLNYSKPVKLIIYDSLGRMVYDEFNDLTLPINISNFKNGIYIINCLIENESYHANFLKL